MKKPMPAKLSRQSASAQTEQPKQSPRTTTAATEQRAALYWLHRAVPYIITASGAVGLFASMMLAIEEVHYLKHPGAPLACDLNPIIGCGSIMDTWQGHALLGIPNQFFGIALFAGIMTIGVSLLAGARYVKWFWQALHLGMFMGFAFVVWFVYQSIFVLRHLCPYCMVTWTAILPAFWYLLLYGIEQEHVRLPSRVQRIYLFARRHHADILAMMFLVVILLILWRFWDYFRSVL